ncbi:hypothetical protein [Bifidobacterium boum]|uniref:hypothetical protein n=1 Tax=Bifidobacterium boum TaxID=78343 RepID=UPI00242F32BE|nr:hypothetical protein [Bifidobacterium boum]MCI5861048.1 hypothetical protein [Bifidobacterium boum]
MALVREMALPIKGVVRNVSVDQTDDGRRFVTLQLGDATGVSDVHFDADMSREAEKVPVGATWQGMVRPYVKYGISRKSNQPYGFLRLVAVKPQQGA